MVLKRLNLAFKGFFRRIKAGAMPGFPRFRSAERFPGWGCKKERQRLSHRYGRGLAVFFHAIELERSQVSYRAAIIDLDEARSIADGAADIVAPFLRAESALLRLDREGLHVLELSMADPSSLPEPGVRFDAPVEAAPAL